MIRKMGKFKYFGAYIVPLLGLFTFHSTGLLAYFGLFFLYVMVPILEYILKMNEEIKLWSRDEKYLIIIVTLNDSLVFYSIQSNDDVDANRASYKCHNL